MHLHKKTPPVLIINGKNGKLYDFSYHNCVNHSEQIKTELISEQIKTELINKAFCAISYPDCKTYKKHRARHHLGES